MAKGPVASKVTLVWLNPVLECLSASVDFHVGPAIGQSLFSRMHSATAKAPLFFYLCEVLAYEFAEHLCVTSCWEAVL